MDTQGPAPTVEPAHAERPYDLAVFIGRFQPFHYGHLACIRTALTHADNAIVIVGSSGGARSHRNPFTFDERAAMIRGALPEDERTRVFVLPVADFYNDERWMQAVQAAVQNAAAMLHDHGSARIALVGHSKDSTGYYLRLFPTWKSIEAPNYNNIHGTRIREAYFSAIGDLWLKNCDGHRPGDSAREHLVPTSVKTYLADFATTAAYALLRREYEWVVSYRQQWAESPYPPTFVTVDACVVQSGHVLLVQRKAFPGNGQWALPGGFLDGGETILNGMLRELREETSIKLPPPILRSNIAKVRVFDDPHRSSRGRTITHAHLIHLPHGRLPSVRSGSDAAAVRWWPLADLRRDLMFEDHYQIIDALVTGLE